MISVLLYMAGLFDLAVIVFSVAAMIKASEKYDEEETERFTEYAPQDVAEEYPQDIKNN